MIEIAISARSPAPTIALPGIPANGQVIPEGFADLFLSLLSDQAPVSGIPGCPLGNVSVPETALNGKATDFQVLATLLKSLGIKTTPMQLEQLGVFDRAQLRQALEFASRKLLEPESHPEAVLGAMLQLLPRSLQVDPTLEPNSEERFDDIPSLPGTPAAPVPWTFPESTIPPTRNDLRQVVQDALDQLTRETKTSHGEAVPVKIAQADPVDQVLSGLVMANEPTGDALAIRVTTPDIQTPSASALASSPASVPTAGIEVRSTPVDPPVRPASLSSNWTHPLARQVMEGVGEMSWNGGGEIRLRLSPAHLGEVSVIVRRSEVGTGMEARLDVATETARAVLVEQTPQLREAFSRQGVQLEVLVVQIAREQMRDGQGRSRERDRNGQHHGERQDENSHVVQGLPVVTGLDTGRRNGLNTLELWT